MSESRPVTLHDRQTALFWLLGFVSLQFVCQLALLVPQLAVFRMGFRSAAFAGSLVALMMVSGSTVKTPVRYPLIGSLTLLLMELFHPGTNTPLAGLAQITLSLAILAPVFWVARLRLDAKAFFALISFLWFFHTVSASVGVLQTLFPGRFDMPISTVVTNIGLEEGLKIQLADGSKIFRPTGLTDMPGGASSAGFMAYLFGLGFLSTSRRLIVVMLSVVAIGVGLYCIFLSQVRLMFVLAIICTLTFMGGLLVLKRGYFLTRLLLILPIIVVGSTVAAFTIGGDSTIDRLKTLIEDDPQKVYGKNRGQFLEETFSEHLPNHPFGAGLGRWGMMRSYFGDENNPDSPPIWVELQVTAWVIDGGLPLLILYGLAMFVAIVNTLRLALKCPDVWVSTWGLLVVGYDLALLAGIVSYVPFSGQFGLEFWLFNTAYWMTVRYTRSEEVRST